MHFLRWLAYLAGEGLASWRSIVFMRNEAQKAAAHHRGDAAVSSGISRPIARGFSRNIIGGESFMWRRIKRV